jgi:hypothetical protein
MCLDGSDDFLDLTTGEVVKGIKTMPLESIVYNLTMLYIKYSDRYSTIKDKTHGS